MRNLTVIVTACGAPGGPGIIKALRQVKERKLTIVGTDANPYASGLFLSDEAYVVPQGQLESYIPAMLEVVERTAADVILPLSSMELLPLSQNKKKLGRAKVLVNKEKALEIALDKGKSYDFMSQNGIAVPDYHRVRDYDQFLEAVNSMGYPNRPVCFKPSVSKGQRGFRILREDADLKKLLLESKPDSTTTNLEMISHTLTGGLGELLVMEYLEGPEYSIDSLVENGNSLVIVPRRRQETKLGISSVGVVEKNEEIIETTSRINKALSFNYNINVQLKYSRDATPKLVEINPRVSGTICLSSAAGPNLPYLAIKMGLGEEFAIPPISWGLTMIRFWDEVYASGPPSFIKIDG